MIIKYHPKNNDNTWSNISFCNIFDHADEISVGLTELLISAALIIYDINKRESLSHKGVFKPLTKFKLNDWIYSLCLDISVAKINCWVNVTKYSLSDFDNPDNIVNSLFNKIFVAICECIISNTGECVYNIDKGCEISKINYNIPTNDWLLIPKCPISCNKADINNANKSNSIIYFNKLTLWWIK